MGTKTKIERLTAAQEAMLPVYRDKWLAHGLSCEPANLERCKAAATLAYRAAGLEPPKLWLLLDSPLSGAIGAALLNQTRRDQVRAQARDQVWDQVWDQVRAMRFSSHEAGYLGWHDFFLSEIRLASSEPIRGLVELAKECGWWAPYKGVAIFQHRHSELRRDDRGRLHNESGMAVRYRDGWGVWAIHGVRVTERIVMQPEALTVKEIKAEENAEVRRIMRERFGEGRYLQETGAKLVHADYETARKGAAPRALLIDDEKQRWLVGTDGSTGRTYYMRVPDDVTTCREAHNALSGFDEAKILAKS